jgi:hypothetical protein
MVWLSGVTTYEQAEAAFERIGGYRVPRTSIWEHTQKQGARLVTYQAQQASQVSIERIQLAAPGQDHPQRKGVSIDGGKVNLRGEGWKEFKLGAVFDVATHEIPDKTSPDLLERARAVNPAYVGVLGSAEQFAPVCWALAVAHDIPQAADSCVVADGADWIWNLTADYFPDSAQIVDWYHARHHLAQAADARCPQDPTAAQGWLKTMSTALFRGEIWKITYDLDQAGLDDHSHYFHTHQRRMQYLEFRENAYPLGSGCVESGIKQFKARLTGAGMRWSRAVADRMLVIRAAILSDTFDALWAAA